MSTAPRVHRGASALQTIAPAQAPARCCHTPKELGEVTPGEEQPRGLLLHPGCTHSHRRVTLGSPGNLPAETIHPFCEHPSATVLLPELAGDLFPSPCFPLGSKAVEMAKQKQDIQEPEKGTACTHCSVWVPAETIGQNPGSASRSLIQTSPFCRRQGGTVTPSGPHLLLSDI